MYVVCSAYLRLHDIFTDLESQQRFLSGFLEAAGSRLNGPAALNGRPRRVHPEVHRVGCLRRDGRLFPRRVHGETRRGCLDVFGKHRYLHLSVCLGEDMPAGSGVNDFTRAESGETHRS